MFFLKKWLNLTVCIWAGTLNIGTCDCVFFQYPDTDYLLIPGVNGIWFLPHQQVRVKQPELTWSDVFSLKLDERTAIFCPHTHRYVYVCVCVNIKYHHGQPEAVCASFLLPWGPKSKPSLFAAWRHQVHHPWLLKTSLCMYSLMCLYLSLSASPAMFLSLFFFWSPSVFETRSRRGWHPTRSKTKGS